MPVDDSYTKVLLHMDGSDGSTTFTDESGKTWTANGNAQIDTAQSKFGGASGLFDGTGDWIDTPDHSDWTLGSGDFTFDLWIRRNANGLKRLFGQSDSAATTSSISFGAALDSNNKVNFGFYSGSTPYIAISAGTITADSIWHHLAFVRNGNTITIYIDGTADGTVSVTGVSVNDSANKVSIGRLGEYASDNWDGWLDEFRFSKGIARWTANFTPPTSAYASASGGSNFFPFF